MNNVEKMAVVLVSRVYEQCVRFVYYWLLDRLKPSHPYLDLDLELDFRLVVPSIDSVGLHHSFPYFDFGCRVQEVVGQQLSHHRLLKLLLGKYDLDPRLWEFDLYPRHGLGYRHRRYWIHRRRRTPVERGH